MDYLDIESLSDECTVVAGTFITPYPPGYPVVLPGEVVRGRHLKKLLSEAGGDIHGLVKGRDGERLVRCRILT